MQNIPHVQVFQHKQEMTAPVFDPSTPLPFFGYRFFEAEEKPYAELMPSLIHFYESEKFRGTSEELRKAIADSRSLREVRKISQKNRSLWRKDWNAIRGRVFRAGLAMQVVQSRKALTMAKLGFNESIAIAGEKHIGGLPGTFISNELQAFFQNPNTVGTARLGVIALNGCVPDDIEDRLNTLFTKGKPVSAAVYSGSDADPVIERWCAMNAIPVRLTSLSSSRLREEDSKEVTARINTLVTCMPNTRKGPTAILAAAAAKRPKIKVLDLAIKPVTK